MTNSMASEIWVLNMCDTEPDREIFGGMPMTQRTGKQTWRGVTDALPRFIDRCDSIRDDCGLPLKMTLFIRSDLQISEFYGRPGWALYAFGELWDTFMKRGHEIAWHPHLWRWSDKRRSWYQEMFDEKWIREECLKPGYEDFCGYLPVRISRMGWCYHNNCSMQQINQLGIMADFSGLAGMVSGIRNELPMHNYSMYDWSLTPSYPYRPSVADYRKSARNGEKALSVLEVPAATLRLPVVRRIKRIIKNVLYQQRFYQSPRMLINMHSSHQQLVLTFLKQQVQRAKQEKMPVIYSWYLHADDLLSENTEKAVLRNIKYLQNMAKKEGVNLIFKTASQVAEHILRFTGQTEAPSQIQPGADSEARQTPIRVCRELPAVIDG